MANFYGRIGPLDPNNGEDFFFDFAIKPNATTRLAPKSMMRTYSALYAPSPVAVSDHIPEEWRANNSTKIQIEFEIVGTQQLDVESELRRLRKFMRKDRRTGEPIDLVLVLGQKSWTVRIDNMAHTPTLWNENTNEQRCKVSMQFHTQRWEDA